MKLKDISSHLAHELKLNPFHVEATLQLIDSGNTLPFIARYRKETTGNMEEEKLHGLIERLQYLRNLVKRQEEILFAIESQEKLTPELANAIESATKIQELEDLYLPFRPKKRTRAQIARKRGLEPLAQRMMQQNDPPTVDRLFLAAEYLSPKSDIVQPEEALVGARDIIAEMLSEQIDIRGLLRRHLWINASLCTELVAAEPDASDFMNFRDYRESIHRIPPHRILAVNRGETKKVLRVRLDFPHQQFLSILVKKIIRQPSCWQQDLEAALHDGYKRLLFPSLERETRNTLTENAEKQSIQLFGKNLRQLLLTPPLAGHTVLGLDPGFRSGCKAAIVNPQGKVLATAVLYLTHSEAQRQSATQQVLRWISDHDVSLVSIGNGTASFETEEYVAGLIRSHKLSLHYVIVNEAGASVYSASKLAKEELPELDVSLRGAVSIARRVQDPLAELVKIEPKAIGVGQYQHDVDQKSLMQTLDGVVETAVNHVGVNLNTASVELLKHVAGIQALVAKNIVAWRDQNGNFRKRSDLLAIPRLGKSAFVQCAGFLRVPESSNPLDNTPVHPESYELAEKILVHLGFEKTDLRKREILDQFQKTVSEINASELAQKLDAGEPTVRDILSALVKPGRDPREDLPPPLTRRNIVSLSDLVVGSKVKGTIHNVTDFGAFVDIGVKINGLLHKSELSYRPFRHPLDIVAVGDIVEVVILHVDSQRNRIGLSLKQVDRS